MIPGMNKKQMKQMERQMKKMGMKMGDMYSASISFDDFKNLKKSFKDIKEKSIKKAISNVNKDFKMFETMEFEKELIIDNPSVSLMNVMGQETYQIDGKAREVELEYEIEIPEEDIEMVANSAGVSKDDAKAALEECKGDLAEAIMKLNQ